MHRYVLCLVAGLFLLGGMPVAAGPVLQFLAAPYLNSNAYADADAVADSGSLLRLRLGDVHPLDGLVLSWSAAGEALVSFQLPDQSNLLGQGRLACRLLLGDAVLEAALGGRLNGYPVASKRKSVSDNEKFSHRALDAEVLLRLDGESGSLWFGYGHAATAYPDYDLDYGEHSLRLRALVDLAADTTLEAEAALALRAYGERFLLDAAGMAGSERSRETTFTAGCELSQAFDVGFSLELSLDYERLSANGNFYFFGPFETELVVDGDEQLIDDFFSRHAFGVRLTGRYRIASLLLAPELAYRLVRYDTRPAFNAADEPLTHTPRRDSIPQLGLAADWRLGEAFTLLFRTAYARSFSNSARSDYPAFSVSLGIEIDL